VSRDHRLVTVPSGLLLFGCIALPAYRGCGRNTAVYEDPYFAAASSVGLLVAIAALAFANRERERGVAFASTVLTSFVFGLFALGVAYGPGPVYAGITMGAATAMALLFGTVLWLFELRDRQIGWALLAGGTLLVALLAVTAAYSTWFPPPAKEVNFVGPLLLH
jgi:cytochrome bd-type quinol oxidase subunit 2